MRVIRRMVSGQTRPNVDRFLNLSLPSTVTTIIKNADKIKHSTQQSTVEDVTDEGVTELLEVYDQLFWNEDLEELYKIKS